MEAASLAFAVVSLLDACLTAIRVRSDNKHFSTDFQSLECQLLWQQGYLKSWARKWGIDIDNMDGIGASSSGALLEREAREANFNLALVERTLASMQKLIMEAEQNSSRHSIDEEPPKNLLRHFVPDKAKVAWSRCRWVSTDKTRLESVVSNLRAHNDDLGTLRPRGDFSSIKSARTTAASEALVIMASLGLTLPQSTNSNEDELNQILAMMLNAKETEAPKRRGLDRNLEIQEWPGKIDFYESTNHINYGDTRRTALFRESLDVNKFQKTHSVLIEWKNLGPTGATQRLGFERTDTVARLLSTPGQPDDSRGLLCLGYFKDRIDRCGLVFRLPPQAASLGEHVQVSNLLEQLVPKKQASLAQRFQLAWTLSSAMLKLHLCSWLHKDFRSENIVFFHGKDQKPDLASPFIAAFGLARPDQINLVSESSYGTHADKNAREMAYCHPDYEYSTERAEDEKDAPSNRPKYQQAFDVYSLGCVLLEIGLWQPLHAEWDKYRERYGTQRHTWQRNLISDAKRRLGFLCGPAYRDVVVACLSAELGDPDGGVDKKKVNEFCWTIVRVLENLRV